MIVSSFRNVDISELFLVEEEFNKAVKLQPLLSINTKLLLPISRLCSIYQRCILTAFSIAARLIVYMLNRLWISLVSAHTIPSANVEAKQSERGGVSIMANSLIECSLDTRITSHIEGITSSRVLLEPYLFKVGIALPKSPTFIK